MKSIKCFPSTLCGGSLKTGQSGKLGHLLGARGVFFRSEAAIVSGKAAIEILAREREEKNRISIATWPLTIAASLRKKTPLTPRVTWS